MVRGSFGEAKMGQRADGLCGDCHVEEPVQGLSRCQSCREKFNAKEAIRRADRRAKGLCVTCGKPAAKDRKYCTEHLAYYLARWHGIEW